MDFDNNGVGVLSAGNDHLEIANSRIANSTDFGVDALNTREVLISNSEFINNGGVGDAAIRLRADALGNYSANLSNNIITGAADAGITVVSSGAGDGSTLSLVAFRNEITSSLANADGIHVDWSGPAVGVFDSNAIHGIGGNNDGLDLTARSAVAQSQWLVTNSLIDFNTVSGTGIRLETMGPSAINVNSNIIDLGGANGTGMNFTLASAANVSLATNLITDFVSGGTGVLFSSVTGPSTFAINGNQIQLLDAGAGFDRGIIFGAVANTVTLSGTVNNTVIGATQSFFIPLGTSNGAIGVNGVFVP